MVSVSRVLRRGQRLAGRDQLADARLEGGGVADHLEAHAVVVAASRLPAPARAGTAASGSRPRRRAGASSRWKTRTGSGTRPRARRRRARWCAPPRRPCDARRRAAAGACFAQRPLPSMMIAMCRGTARGAGISRVELSNTGGGCGRGRGAVRERLAMAERSCRRQFRPALRPPSGPLPWPGGPCRSRRCSGR